MTLHRHLPVCTRLVALGCLAALTGGVGATSAASAASAAPAAKFPATCIPRPTPIDAHPALSDVSYVAHGRLRTYTMTSAAVGTTHVNVLLPAGYDRAKSRRYPVLYLLHGALGSYADWASTAVVGDQPQGGDVESIVGTLPIIVVMPDDSPNGSYTDWYGMSTTDAARRPPPRIPAWETYHIDELIPWVDSTFPTQATAAGRVIAGLSSGGGGTAKYATAHPGLFGFAGMFSGALDNNLVDGITNTYSQSGIFHSSQPPDDHCAFGDPFTADAQNSAYYWYDNDPTYKAGNLGGVKLFVTSGNGAPTAADAHTLPVIRSFQGAIEVVVDDESHHFVAAVRRAGLGANLTTDFYGAGVHSWHYWQRDLAAFLNWVRPQLNQRVATPSTFAYRTARATSAAWGWSFAYRSGLSVPNVNTAKEFVYLSRVSPSGFDVSGNGTLRVTTPKGSYAALSSHDVTIGRVTTTTRANHDGQLTFDVVLGAPATHQQLVFPVAGAPPGTPRVQVSILATPQPAHHARTWWPIALIAAAAALLALALGWRLRRRPAS